MANLKLDLLNKLNNDKYFEELELVRLAQDPNMNYREKIDLMSKDLAQIAVINAQVGLVEEYFKQSETQVASQTAPNPAPTGQVHQGQTHGE